MKKRNYIFVLAMILLSASAGCRGWNVNVKTIDADTGQPIPQVKATWIISKRVFMTYTHDEQEKFTSADGSVAFLKRPNSSVNAIAFEHPLYLDADAGIGRLHSGVADVRVVSPVDLSKLLPWDKTKRQNDKGYAPATMPEQAWIFTNNETVVVRMYKKHD